MSLIDSFLRAARWRWTPFVGPTVGTGLFVLTLAWLVPDDVGAPGRSSSRPSLGASLETSTTNDDSSEPAEAPTNNAASRDFSDAPRTPSTSQGRRRGFSPPLERPAPPAAPPPAEPPPPQPPSVQPASEQQFGPDGSTHQAARVVGQGVTDQGAAPVETPPDAPAPPPPQ